MKQLTKAEKGMLLQFAECNRDCDMDFCSYARDEERGYLLNMYGSDKPKDIKKAWNVLIKKLKGKK